MLGFAQSFIQKQKASTSPSQSAADTAEQPRKKGWKEGVDMTQHLQKIMLKLPRERNSLLLPDHDVNLVPLKPPCEPPHE